MRTYLENAVISLQAGSNIKNNTDLNVNNENSATIIIHTMQRYIPTVKRVWIAMQ